MPLAFEHYRRHKHARGETFPHCRGFLNRIKTEIDVTIVVRQPPSNFADTILLLLLFINNEKPKKKIFVINIVLQPRSFE